MGLSCLGDNKGAGIMLLMWRCIRLLMWRSEIQSKVCSHSRPLKARKGNI